MSVGSRVKQARYCGLLFTTAKQTLLGKGYTVMEPFADLMSTFVSPSCSTALGQINAFTHLSLLGLVRFVMNMHNGEETLQSE